MRKLFIFVSFVLFTQFISAQLISGSLIEEGRKMTSPFDFTIKGNYRGFQYFKLSVNSNGEVTSVQQIEEKESLVSTPAKLMAIKELYKLTFDGATYFPKYQHVNVKITFITK